MDGQCVVLSPITVCFTALFIDPLCILHRERMGGRGGESKMVSDDRLFLERRQIKSVSSPFALYFQNAFFFITKNGSDEKTKKHQSGSTSNKKVKS